MHSKSAPDYKTPWFTGVLLLMFTLNVIILTARMPVSTDELLQAIHQSETKLDGLSSTTKHINSQLDSIEGMLQSEICPQAVTMVQEELARINNRGTP
jgi:peptidoglycan hydrolase CwlO-like protein